jgi:hypothetical protein
MSQLLNVLTDLAKDPQKQKTFLKDPKSWLESTQLSHQDKLVVSSGDRNKIAEVFMGEFHPLAAIVVDPGPDPLPDPDPPEPPEQK